MNGVNMKTNWDLIRNLSNSVIDACEMVDRLGISEDDRDRMSLDGDQSSASVFDYLQSAWTYPENLSRSIVRARNKLGEDKPYSDELGRALAAVGQLSAELVGMEATASPVTGVNPLQPDEEKSVEEMIAGLCDWYRLHMKTGLSTIMSGKDEAS